MEDKKLESNVEITKIGNSSLSGTGSITINGMKYSMSEFNEMMKRNASIKKDAIDV